MKVKKTTNIDLDLRTSGLPLVHIKFHKVFGFCFLIDTSVKHNLLDPCVMEFVIQSEPTEEELSSPNFFEDGTFNWNHRDPVIPIHQNKGKKRVICKDGIRKVCDMIKLDFTIENGADFDEYSELFVIDPNMCNYFHSTQCKFIIGVLGNDFLKKHKWILDYSLLP